MDEWYLNPGLLATPVGKTARPIQDLQTEHGRESNEELIKTLEQVLRKRPGQ
jgi:hypothetical protein